MRFSVENAIFTVYTNVNSLGLNPTYVIVDNSVGLTVLILHLGIYGLGPPRVLSWSTSLSHLHQ